MGGLTPLQTMHSCTKKPLPILNTGPITTFLPTSLSIFLKWKINKKNVQRSEWNCEEKIFPTHVCLLLQSVKWRCKQINKKKTFFVTKFPLCFVGMSVCTRGVICFTFALWRLTSYFLILKEFYMLLFGRFSFWMPTHFSEVIKLIYGPVLLTVFKDKILFTHFS